MKLSKSILSPSHARHDPPLTLPTSLSRRLKANGSIKGGQSPATFPNTTGKKRGSGFDNPEPSSPKVTCIGQVKMKTKKKVRQTRNLSNRRSDISFRKLEEERGYLIQNQRSSSVHLQTQDQCAAVVHRNQRWVHLPLTIYEALREFSCLFPCRSSCFSTNEKGNKENKVNGSREVGDNNNGQRNCGDVVARWLVALQDGETEENTREIELMVTNNGKEEEENEEKMEEMQSRMRSSRRHVFEGIEFKDHIESVEMKEEKARVSICIPPKNALLLMRCRSDPMKMTDITNRFWESPTRKETNEEVDTGVEELVDTENIECKVETSVSVDLVENEENPEAVVEIMEMETESSQDEEKLKCDESTPETEGRDGEESEIKALVAAAEVNSIEQVPESIVDQTNEEISIQSFSSFSENEEHAILEEDEEDERFKSIIKKVIEETLLLEHIDREDVKQTHHNEEAKFDAAFSDPEKNKIEKEEQNESILPDCLLLMMCEPKLSMEVSKETWVCSTTELKQAKTVKKKKEIPEDPKRRRSIDKSKQHLLQPPRSSCSFPATGVPPAMSSMATMIEQKLVNAVAYEPFVLTRCKSEPMRSAATATAVKLAPETCFWKNMKIEPHRRATFGFGAAGVGF
ncbi:uncharacterized protein LOC129871450 [Solanum dulcamara]|uniref:uncharacterized protein LOC129871450 n=1 Tax=Solanum dulcamara TaxID=45834 RepID=UPI0024853335|nr:uncharacterized protein LOC129871450 [Solanum dulcamara]